MTRPKEIEEWTDKNIEARHKLPVLLRWLILSTGRGINRIEFPGHDNAERHGWDGFLSASEATPWIPEGDSVWEFGTNESIRSKAQKDYESRVKNISRHERANLTFVFVTPRNWSSKNDWVETRQAENEWRDVRAYDASNLEEWLSQSIPGQVWFKNDLGKPFGGTLSLETCWQQWQADCHPEFVPDIFAEAIAAHRGTILDTLRQYPDRLITIAADSPREALAFLHVLFSDVETQYYRAQAIVFERPEPLAELMASKTKMLPIIADEAAINAFLNSGQKMGGIIIRRHEIGAKPDVILRSLSDQAFTKALSHMGLTSDEIDRLACESGRSLTVLRRRLARRPELHAPRWSTENELTRYLPAFLFAGAWDENNPADKAELARLAGVEDYSKLEQPFLRLLEQEEPPVWRIGTIRGIVSKIDAMYTACSTISPSTIKLFREVAECVLGEDDPSLELPEKERWYADIHGKTRKISKTLRSSIGESVVLLSVEGQHLFGQYLSADLQPQFWVNQLVRKLLSPFTINNIKNHQNDLRFYAEAAPQVFLNILENDLDSENPEIFKALPTVDDPFFHSSPRCDLLWALEILAWSEDYFHRVVEILARLATVELQDNLMNKPISTLESLFRCWMPQTATPLATRKAELSYLAKSYPAIGWKICIKQFNLFHTFGHYNQKPKWRDYALGAGEPLRTTEEVETFRQHAIALAVGWRPSHSKDTLGDLVSELQNLPASWQEKIWDAIETWAKDAADPDKAFVREQIRRFTFTRRSRIRHKQGKVLNDPGRAKRVYDLLAPQDLLAKHGWLFQTSWLDYSQDELEDEGHDYRQRDEQIATLRRAALQETLHHHGLAGVLRLALSGEAAGIAGDLLAGILPTHAEREELLLLTLQSTEIIEDYPRQWFLRGLFWAMQDDQEQLVALLQSVEPKVERDTLILLLTLLPFQRSTWSFVEQLGTDVKHHYWKTLNATIYLTNESSDDLHYAVQNLLNTHRPREAFSTYISNRKKFDLKQLYKILYDIPYSSGEDAHRIDSHYVNEAIEEIQKSGLFSVDEMAAIEFLYLDALRFSEGKLFNIGKQIENNPEMFVEAICYLYKRQDGTVEDELLDTERKKFLADRAYHLLDTLTYIPGHDKSGILCAENLKRWIHKVQEIARKKGRSEIADHYIGKLLGKASKSESGVWPCTAVRDALEETLNRSIAEGVKIALWNSRGVHWRGEGGAQERELAEQYEAWARAQEDYAPRVAHLLREMKKGYLQEAERQDQDAVIRRRLR